MATLTGSSIASTYDLLLKIDSGGIDGTFPDGTPIEVKQRQAGRPDIQKFHSAIITAKKKKGLILATSFPKTVYESIATIKKESDITIIPFTVTQLLEKDFSPITKARIQLTKRTDLRQQVKKPKE